MSMIKVIPPDSSASELGYQVAQLVKIGSSGLRGPDLNSLIKRAGHEFAEAVRNMTLDKGEVPIHMIALGATEAVGPNRNGDGFKIAACRKYHDTFVKHARWYRNHKNKDPKKSYGVVKMSSYNEAMRRIELLVALNGTKEAAARNDGFVADEELERLEKGAEIGVSMACRVAYDVCFPSYTLVETHNGLKPIAEIGIGTRVKTHTGKFRKVNKIIRRDYSGDMTSISIQGIPNIITATGNHPVMVVKEDSVRSCSGSSDGVKRRHKPNDKSVCSYCHRKVDLNRNWTEARDIKAGDYVVYPIEKPGNVVVDKEDAYLLGLYVGDGSLIGKRRGKKRQGERRTVGVSFSLGTDHPAIIAKTCTSISKITGRVQTAYPDVRRHAVQVAAYSKSLANHAETLIGKGSATKKIDNVIFSWNREARLNFLAGLMDSDGSVDKNKRLGMGRHTTINQNLAYSIQRLWWGLGVSASVQENTTNSFGKPCRVFVVSVSRAAVNMLSSSSVKAEGVGLGKFKNSSRCFFADGFIHIPVTEVTRSIETLEVFNLSVDVDETYIAEGITVHNCSGCNNKAKNRDHYCLGSDEGGSCKYGGLKNNIGIVHESGHHLHADNPHPLYFDISKVHRPADRTAFVTGKVASSGIVGGAELAEALGVSAPFDLLDESCYTSATLNQIKLAREMASRENTYVRNDYDHSITTYSSLDGIENFDHYQRPGVLRALLVEKIALSLGDWLKLTTGDSEEKLAEAIADINHCLPTVFSDLVEDPNLPDYLRSNPYRAGNTSTDTLRNWASKYANDCSLDSSNIRRRVWRGTFSNSHLPSVRTKSASSVSESARQVAKQYAVYQIGFLYDLGSDKEIDLTKDLIIRHNRVM